MARLVSALVSGKDAPKATPITLTNPTHFETWIGKQSAGRKDWCSLQGFTGKPGQSCLVPSNGGKLSAILVGIEEELQDIWGLAALADRLAEGDYRLSGSLKRAEAEALCLGWCLGKGDASLVAPKSVDVAKVSATADAVRLARRLISAPPNTLGPQELEDEARAVAKTHGAKISVITGDDLLAQNYPAIHVVGQAAEAARAPRLIDLTWGKSGPKVTLVGKGVVFDTGGLDLKSAAGMRWMKKDMGGAAHTLALAGLIMQQKLPVQLRLLIPAVENAVSERSYRPGDVINTRKGTTVEVGNTDAEGRLILSDALFEAAQSKPDVILDFATLTGAARVALGADLPALFCNDDTFADQILKASDEAFDPLWRMPLHQPYAKLLKSPFADLCNISEGGLGGAITAALFLEHFVEPKTPWAHIDLMAFNNGAKPGRPKGGEAMGLRACFAAIEKMANG